MRDMKAFDLIELMQEKGKPPSVQCQIGGETIKGDLTEIQRTLDIGDMRPITTGVVRAEDEIIEVSISQIQVRSQLEEKVDEVLDE